jgi:hypothetical protein
MVTRTSFRARVLNLTIVTASSKSARSPDRAHTGTDCQCALLLRTQWQLEHTDSDLTLPVASQLPVSLSAGAGQWPRLALKTSNEPRLEL